MHDQPQQPSATAPRPRMSAKRRWLSLGAVLIVLVVVLAGLSPALVSTGPGTRLALGVLNRRIGGSVEVQKLKLAWFGPQRIDGLQLRGPDGAQVISASQINAPQTSLVAAIRGASLGAITTSGLVADIRRYDDGTTNIERALADRSPSLVKATKPGAADRGRQGESGRFSLSMELIDAELNYQGPQQAPIVATIPKAVFDLTDMSRIRVNLKSTLTQADRSGHVEVDAAISDLFTAEGRLSADRAHVKAKMDAQDIPTAALGAIAGQEDLLVELLGPLVNATLQIAGHLSDFQAHFSVESMHLKFAASARGQASQVLVDSGDSVLQMTVTPAAWGLLAKRVAPLDGTTLGQPINVQLSLKQLRVPLDATRRPRFGDLAMTGQLLVSDMRIDSVASGTTFGLRQTRMDVTTESLGQRAVLTASAVAQRNDLSGLVRLAASADGLLNEAGQLNWSDPGPTIAIEVLELPVAMLEPLAPKLGLTEWLGTTLTGAVRGQLQLTEAGGHPVVGGPMQLTVQSDRLTADLSVVLHPDVRITGQAGRPMVAALQVTPAAFDRLYGQLTADQARKLQLTGPSQLRIQVEDAALVFLSDADLAGAHQMPIDLRRSRLVATLEADARSLRFMDGATGGMRFKALKIRLNAPNMAESIQFNAQVQLDRQNAGDPPDDAAKAVHLAGRVSQLFDEWGTADINGAVITATAQVDELPVVLIDAIAGGQSTLVDLLGQRLSGTLEAERSGPGPARFKLALDSDNVEATVSGQVDRQGVLTLLEKDLQASLKVTAQIGSRFLAPLNPLLADVHSAQKPIELTIRKEGFVVPLNDLRLANVTLDGTLNIGTLSMRQTGITGDLVKGLRLAGSPIQDRRQFDARFTTLQFKVAGGVITSNDLWMDSGDLMLGFQARVSEAPDGSGLQADVLIGIPGQTVQLIPKLARRVAPEALYVLPAHGPLSKLEPDFGALLLPIAATASLGDAGSAIGHLIMGIGEAIAQREASEARPVAKAWSDATWDNRPSVHRRPPADAPTKQVAPPPRLDPLDVLGELLRKKQSN